MRQYPDPRVYLYNLNTREGLMTRLQPSCARTQSPFGRTALKGGFPEWSIKQDVTNTAARLLNDLGACRFCTPVKGKRWCERVSSQLCKREGEEGKEKEEGKKKGISVTMGQVTMSHDCFGIRKYPNGAGN
ncbi:UNVERIFIED_CONTAM: hypothetical protein FKN15_016408 [Acipenser sinensis]